MKKVYSWNVINNTEFYKIVDKSVINSKESGIPHDIRYLFDFDNDKTISIIYKNRSFSAILTTSIIDGTMRSKIRFNSFINSLGNKLKIGDFLYFTKLDKDKFEVELFCNDFIDNDEVINTEIEFTKEGKKIVYYTNRYERDENNRKKAIKIHGLNCSICNFNFKEKYGEIGEGYIEVHHIKPLYSLNEEIIINPKTDLICVCANCHRMIHHSRNHILTPIELKEIIAKEEKKK